MRSKHSIALPLVIVFAIAACGQKGDSAPAAASGAPATAGQANVRDDQSQPTIARIAAESRDHTTLVAALQAANLVDALANAGPFTVFAPTNAAFDKLPAGTVDNLLKPENKSTLVSVLYHHVTTSALGTDVFKDGEVMTMLDGSPATFKVEGDVVTFNGAKIVASVRGSNGWVHVVDAVVVPDKK